ncbi:MAG: hypothetical protein AAF393_13455 [Pseudomonadota bacterium]
MIRLAAALTLCAGPALAAIGNADICAKADREKRLGNMTQSQCTCLLSKGDKRMDPALGKLWKEALYTGKSRVNELRSLGMSEAKMERQMRRTLRDARRDCGVKNPFGF